MECQRATSPETARDSDHALLTLSKKKSWVRSVRGMLQRGLGLTKSDAPRAERSQPRSRCDSLIATADGPGEPLPESVSTTNPPTTAFAGCREPVDLHRSATLPIYKRFGSLQRVKSLAFRSRRRHRSLSALGTHQTHGHDGTDDDHHRTTNGDGPTLQGDSQIPRRARSLLSSLQRLSVGYSPPISVDAHPTEPDGAAEASHEPASAPDDAPTLSLHLDSNTSAFLPSDFGLVEFPDTDPASGKPVENGRPPTPAHTHSTHNEESPVQVSPASQQHDDTSSLPSTISTITLGPSPPKDSNMALPFTEEQIIEAFRHDMGRGESTIVRQVLALSRDGGRPPIGMPHPGEPIVPRRSLLITRMRSREIFGHPPLPARYHQRVNEMREYPFNRRGRPLNWECLDLTAEEREEIEDWLDKPTPDPKVTALEYEELAWLEGIVPGPAPSTLWAEGRHPRQLLPDYSRELDHLRRRLERRKAEDPSSGQGHAPQTAPIPAGLAAGVVALSLIPGQTSLPLSYDPERVGRVASMQRQAAQSATTSARPSNIAGPQPQRSSPRVGERVEPRRHTEQ